MASLHGQNVLDDIRSTDDVDLVIELGGIADWHRLTKRLSDKGFKITAEHSDVTCRFVFNDLIVDVMPSVKEILGYENRWFVDGLANAETVTLPSGLSIKIFKPTYFVATKLEAFKGRGEGNAYHKDVEDILLDCSRLWRAPDRRLRGRLQCGRSLFERAHYLVYAPSLLGQLEARP